jgi:hypothetical protein
MIGNLPEFRLETWFSRWEFAAAHSFSASDAQTMTVASCSHWPAATSTKSPASTSATAPTVGTNELRGGR